jgi:hypothetical protein
VHCFKISAAAANTELNFALKQQKHRNNQVICVATPCIVAAAAAADAAAVAAAAAGCFTRATAAEALDLALKQQQMNKNQMPLHLSLNTMATVLGKPWIFSCRRNTRNR